MYKIVYRDHEAKKIRTITVSTIGDSPFGFSFIKVSGLYFKESKIAIPSLEDLKKSFKGVRALHLNLHSEVLRIVELEAASELDLSPNRLRMIPMPAEKD